MAIKAVAIIRKDATGAPDIGTGWDRWVWVGDLPGQYAVYIIVGTGAQLTAIQAMPTCVGGLVVTNNGARWAELDVAIPAALRTKINTYLVANSLPTIAVGTTLLQVIRKAVSLWDYGDSDVFDGS